MNLRNIKLYSLSSAALLILSGCYSNTDNPQMLGSSDPNAIYQIDDAKDVGDDVPSNPVKTDVVLPDPNYNSNSSNSANFSKDVNLTGIWRMTVNTEPCQISISHTKIGKFFRASTRRCPASVRGIHSWNVDGDKLNLYDKQGKLIVNLSVDSVAQDQDPNSDYTKPTILKYIGTSVSGDIITLSR